MAKRRKRLAHYIREGARKVAGEVQPDGKMVLSMDVEKFGPLIELVDHAQADPLVDAVLVNFPEMLGDTYEEIIMSLEVIAQAGLFLRIIPMSERKGDKVWRVDIDVDEDEDE